MHKWAGLCPPGPSAGYALIRTEPSQYRRLGSVQEALQRIQTIHLSPEAGARSNAPLLITASRRAANAISCALENKAH